jgi:ABC-type sugar transport system substrate-binding protein
MTRISPGRVALAGFALSAALFAGAAGAAENSDHKVSICHVTSSETNEFVLISVDEHAVPAHLENHGDFFPQGDDCDGEE